VLILVLSHILSPDDIILKKNLEVAEIGLELAEIPHDEEPRLTEISDYEQERGEIWTFLLRWPVQSEAQSVALVGTSSGNKRFLLPL
jgi:hypothetical protein